MDQDASLTKSSLSVIDHIHLMHIIKSKRNELGYTQQELAEKSGLSLRTIQRIESGGTIPKGYTLKALSQALGVEPHLIADQSETVNADIIASKVRLINLSALALFGIPFGNVLLPVIIWQKNKHLDPLVNEAGKRIVNFQIWWSVILCLLLTLSPFIQTSFSMRFPLILVVLLASVSLNLFMIGRIAIQINRGNYSFLSSLIRLI